MNTTELIKTIQENWIVICLGVLLLVAAFCEPKKKEKETIHKLFKMKDYE